MSPYQIMKISKFYIDRILTGEENIPMAGQALNTWPKTSGTTSGIKYIPISGESMPEHIRSARNALLCYVYETGNADFLDGKMIFLQGSPVLDVSKGGSNRAFIGHCCTPCTKIPSKKQATVL